MIPPPFLPLPFDYQVLRPYVNMVEMSYYEDLGAPRKFAYCVTQIEMI